ncbi:hypothetical protein VTL71DRAFT_12193 [Oculimacula yallundae]|uniref:Uncharacterized protein n=1 Tax=Oculimacula yallundae TaxID=86028 RepID=A0ABR4CSL1_9HELO
MQFNLVTQASLAGLMVVAISSPSALATPVAPAIPFGKTLTFTNKCHRNIVANQAFPAPPGSNAGTVGPNMILEANGGSITVEMTAENPAAKGGVSTKFNWVDKSHADGIMQLEHTFVTEGQSAGIFWDASFVDAKGLGPFFDIDVSLTPSDMSCLPVFCKAGEVCEAGYQYPEDTKTRFCSLENESLEVVFCDDEFEDTVSARPIPKHFAHHG